MAYTMESKVGDLLKDPKAVKVLEKYVPGITKNPMIAFVKGSTLSKLLALPQAKDAGLTKEMVEKVLLEINTQK